MKNLSEEGIVGAGLAAIMVLIFLGSVRSMFIVLLSLPLAIMAACVGLYFGGESLNAITLGGLALAVGLLIDQSIVVLENITRHQRMGNPSFQAALDGAAGVATPMLIITLAIIAVLFPVDFLAGIGKFLFTPLALAVAFALIASYILAMTLVPTCASRFLKTKPTKPNDETGSDAVDQPSHDARGHGFERWFDPISN